MPLGRPEDLDQPVRAGRQDGGSGGPCVDLAGAMAAWWGDDVAAVAADVDAGTEPASGVVGHVEAGMGEVEVASS